MREALVKLALICLMAIGLWALTPSGAMAGAFEPGGIGAVAEPQPLWTKVLVWRDCQRIARCTGCQPVYHCRSCSYQKSCSRGLCEWGDVCVWGPYLPLAPKGVRIIQ